MQVPDQNTFLKLIEKYLSGSASREEVQVLENYYELFNEGPNALDHFSLADLQKIETGLKSGIESKIQFFENPDATPIRKQTTNQFWLRIAASAAIFLVICTSLFFYDRYAGTHHDANADQNLGRLNNEIKPGSNKAYLTLTNGKRLSLTDADNYSTIKEAGIEISKTADGQLIYSSQPLPPSGKEITGSKGAFNTIETPRGGQYQVRLPDGSKVWLNADSKLTFPVSFAQYGKREVNLDGEAYFEIHKDKRHPFRVKSAGQVIEVLGTHFNVSSYADEHHTKTTLLEGSVSISSRRDYGADQDSVVLKPGQQSTIEHDHNFKIKVQEVQDLEIAVAWKNGNFYFADEPMEEAMKKIARWYNLEVVFQDNARVFRIAGIIPRKTSLSNIIKLFEIGTSCNFKIDGRKVLISKKRTN